MRWKALEMQESRMSFLSRVSSGKEKMTDLCWEYEIS